MIRYYYTT